MIYLCAGHTNTKGKTYDPGAMAHGYKESELAAELRNLIAEELKALGCIFKTDKDDETLGQTIFNAGTGPNDVVFDIHFNAATPAATGTEIFIPIDASEREKRFAKEIVEATARILGIPNRGVKTEDKSQHKRLGMMRPKGENMLWEVCFITNDMDMFNFQGRKAELCKEIASIIRCCDDEVK